MDKMQSKNNIMNQLINDLAQKRVPTDLKGFEYLTQAVDACIVAPQSSIIDIYKCIADKHGVKHKTVMREISYALSHIERRCAASEL